MSGKFTIKSDVTDSNGHCYIQRLLGERYWTMVGVRATDARSLTHVRHGQQRNPTTIVLVTAAMRALKLLVARGRLETPKAFIVSVAILKSRYLYYKQYPYTKINTLILKSIYLYYNQYTYYYTQYLVYLLL